MAVGSQAACPPIIVSAALRPCCAAAPAFLLGPEEHQLRLQFLLLLEERLLGLRYPPSHPTLSRIQSDIQSAIRGLYSRRVLWQLITPRRRVRVRGGRLIRFRGAAVSGGHPGGGAGGRGLRRTT